MQLYPKHVHTVKALYNAGACNFGHFYIRISNCCYTSYSNFTLVQTLTKNKPSI